MTVGRRRGVMVALALVGAAIAVVPPTAVAAPPEAVVDRVDASAERLRGDLTALQAIADRNGGNRATGTPGFAESVDYVRQTLESLGIGTQEHEFKAQNGHKGRNLLADIPGRDPEHAVMLGAHLDSVPTGPGIGDNGTGVAVLLEIARQVKANGLADRTLRLAFWDDEEAGAVGSRQWVAEHTAELPRLTAYLNVDMLALRDGTTQVFDADRSSWSSLPADLAEELARSQPKPAQGSERIERLLSDALRAAGRPVVEDQVLFLSSDSNSFVADVPTGGLVSAPGITPEGVLGECYHQACDRTSYVNEEELRVSTAVLSTVTRQLLMT
ncbi:aminopeptidase [Longimycelium tulufanense]|uniref:Aminopeptidase n=1 Tax=Longimycelium tulufanense TaxID=907463 RepID=A0A8J3FWK9_9PSEU|nr:M20/M25/M40 family metallo-hydrolase [Longimycelium tulufanense]GGM60632.1 aminopeptidase [Longimycelium tulufanense]